MAKCVDCGKWAGYGIIRCAGCRVKPLYFKDGVQFSKNYVRIEHGGRGDYFELEKNQILVKLVSKFGQELPDEIRGDETFYYYWLNAEGREEKIYWQIKEVKYAKYKRGYYYVSVDNVEER